MLFNSLTFVLFFAAVYVVYWRLPHRGQNILLLGASMVFYASWNYKLLPLIIFSASVDYLAGMRIFASRSVAWRRIYLAASILVNLGLLGFFKYYNFFATSMSDLLAVFGFSASIHTLNIILPVGISFYTFQSMSYTIDIYRRQFQPCRNYFDFLLYVSFFPQLVAGPIERAWHLLPRLVKPRRPLSTGRFLDGVKLIVIGYFHKVAVADTLAPIVDRIFAMAANRDAVTMLVGVYAFSLQIYCDFSGYSKIARGTSQLLGIELIRNFDQPYFSCNVQEFWQRWHISLSNWLRDYVYIPLGGNRKGTKRTYFNLIATMLLGGLWHGASWNFVVWGGIHGCYLAVHRVLSRRRSEESRWTRNRIVRVVCTFHLIAFTWLFFRCDSLADVVVFSRRFLKFPPQFGLELMYVGIYGLIVLLLDVCLERSSRRKQRYIVCLFSRNWLIETLGFTFLILVTLLVGENHAEPFIYFQF
jgi:D-alanyl-lipoteichoic acid acyltransferase DltB (MBOAT superfamily)